MAVSGTQTQSLGKLIEREAFGEDPALDNEWHTFATLDPADGELVDGYMVFKLLVEGAAGNDGNAFDVAVSTSEARNVSPEGLMVLNDAPTLRLDGEGVAELRFWIPSKAKSVTVHNFDTAGARLTFDTAFRSVDVSSSAAQGETGETTIDLNPGEADAAAAITFHNDGSETPNDATLYVTDSAGNPIPIELPILVDRLNRRPSQQLATLPLADCRSIVFAGTGTTDPDGDLLTFEWDFGDGQTGEGNKIVHRYDRPGVYVATVRIRDSSGRVGNGVREQLNIFVNQAPRARVRPRQTASPGEAVLFDAAASSDPEGGALVYFWDFGDGSEGKGRQVEHDFKEPGRYKVSLRVEDDSATPCNWDVAEAEIWINAPPVAEAGTDFVASVGETVTLDAGRSYDRDGTLTEWLWDLGDGTKRYGRTVEYAYQMPGKYEIALEVKDDAGATNSSALDRIQGFVNDPPVAEAGADLALAVGGVVFFDASASSDSDGYIVSYDWDFGDGNRGKGERTPYAFDEPGTYRVKLKVRDNSPAASGVGRDSLTVVVNAPPVAKAGPDQTVTTSEVRFDGSSSLDPDGRITRYEWDFGDGTMGEGRRPAHIYQRAGIYHATLKVSDNSGTSSSEALDQITIVVNRRPAADAGPDRTVAPGDAISFAAFESFDTDGDIVGYSWDFGDGATANGKAAKHTYNDPGSYLVRLTVNDNTDDPLAVDYDESVVKVNAEPIPNAGPDIQVAPGETVRLDGSGSFDTDGELTAFHWYFSDGGTTVSDVVVERAFDRPGIYNAKLTVSDDSGVANSQAADNVTIHVNHQPRAVLGNDLHTCDGAIQLDGSASIDGDGQALTYEWDFGDGTNAFGAQVIHVFAEGGVYPVTLTVDDGTGLSNARHSSLRLTEPLSQNPAPTRRSAPERSPCSMEANRATRTVERFAIPGTSATAAARIS